MKWFIATSLPIGIAAVSCIFLAKKIGSQNFKCTECSTVFKPKWTKIFVTMHADEYYELKCPCCGNKGAIMLEK